MAKEIIIKIEDSRSPATGGGGGGKPTSNKPAIDAEIGSIKALEQELKKLKTAQKETTDTVAREKYNRSIDETKKKISELNNAGKEHHNVWGKALDSFQFKFNALGNLIGGAVLGGLTALAAGFKDFAIESFNAAEQEARQSRLLLNGLNQRTSAMFVLTKANDDFKKRFAVDDKVLMELETFGAAQGRSTEQIKKTTEAAFQLAAVTGEDVMSAYKKVDMTYEGSVGKLGKLDKEFNKLSKTQLENGAGVDLLLSKYKGFAESSVTTSQRAAFAWDQFKGGFGTGMVKALENISGLNDGLAETGITTQKLGEWISTGLINNLTYGFTVTKELILAIPNAIIDAIGFISDLFTDFQGTINKVGSFFTDFGDNVVKTYEDIAEWINKLFTAPLTAIEELKQSLLGLIGLNDDVSDSVGKINQQYKNLYLTMAEGGKVGEKAMNEAKYWLTQQYNAGLLAADKYVAMIKKINADWAQIQIDNNNAFEEDAEDREKRLKKEQEAAEKARQEALKRFQEQQALRKAEFNNMYTSLEQQHNFEIYQATALNEFKKKLGLISITEYKTQLEIIKKMRTDATIEEIDEAKKKAQKLRDAESAALEKQIEEKEKEQKAIDDFTKSTIDKENKRANTLLELQIENEKNAAEKLRLQKQQLRDKFLQEMTGDAAIDEERRKKLLNDTQKLEKEYNKKQLDDLKSSLMEAAEAVANSLEERSKKKEEQYNKELDASKKHEEQLRELAQQGIEGASDNLAYEQRKQAELEKKKQLEQKKQKRLEMGVAAINTFSNLSKDGDKNAFGKTVAEIVKLMAFVNSMPEFAEGVIAFKGLKQTTQADDTIAKIGAGESVITAPATFKYHEHLKAMQDLKYNPMDFVQLPHMNNDTNMMKDFMLLKKVDELNTTIKNKPEYNIDVNALTGEIIERIKKGNTVINNHYKRNGLF